MSTNLYRELQKTSSSMNEYNDCAVKAMAVATGESYEDCHAAFELGGRKYRDGTWPHSYKIAADLLGYELTQVWRKHTDPEHLEKFPWVPECKTPISTERNIPHDVKCIMVVDGHAIGVRGAKVHDWTTGRRHHVKYFYIVTPKGQSA
jgi:hypothetical protein